MNSPAFHATPEAAFLPAALDAYHDLKVRGLLHKYVLHRRSSQAFALNLFAPLDQTGRQQVFASAGLGEPTHVDLQFEYADPRDELNEAVSPNGHQTQVDVLMTGLMADGRKVAALIEVKFTEQDFGHCSAYLNPANPARDVCRSSGAFGGQPARCFQLAGHGKRRRRYDDFLDLEALARFTTPDGGCLVRRSLNQPMRNIALGEALTQRGEVDKYAYAMCTAASNDAVNQRISEVLQAFGDDVVALPLSASMIAGCHSDGGDGLAVLYMLDCTSPHTSIQRASRERCGQHPLHRGWVPTAERSNDEG